MIWTLAAVYSIVGFVTACRIGTLLAWHFYQDGKRKYPSLHGGRIHPNGEQWFGSMATGLAAGTIWPLMLVCYGLRSWLFAPPKEIQYERQKKRIQELERELGMR